MAKRRLKGLRDIPTMQGLHQRKPPASREEIVAEQARLEHEKARLERELEHWISYQRKTENHQNAK